jgi:hypothetical protein
MLARVSALIILPAALAAMTPAARAINWEGHDDFFHEAVPLPRLTTGIETPKPKLPPCSAREVAARDNPYEQQPLPGSNCIEDRKVE